MTDPPNAKAPVRSMQSGHLDNCRIWQTHLERDCNCGYTGTPDPVSEVDRKLDKVLEPPDDHWEWDGSCRESRCDEDGDPERGGYCKPHQPMEMDERGKNIRWADQIKHQQWTAVPDPLPTDPLLEVLKSIDEKLGELYVCGHGTRGWCPNCARWIADGTAPADGNF
jgi:hypothetical protein